MKIQKSSLKTGKTIPKQNCKNVCAAAKGKAEAVKYIRCAIDALGAQAKGGDKQAKGTIADLSVILFDLK